MFVTDSFFLIEVSTSLSGGTFSIAPFPGMIEPY